MIRDILDICGLCVDQLHSSPCMSCMSACVELMSFCFLCSFTVLCREFSVVRLQTVEVSEV